MENSTDEVRPEYDFGRRVVSAYKVIEPVLTRPAMYFGRKSITAFFHWYHGMSHLGGCGHGGPFMFKLLDDLQSPDGFTDWACKKHDWSWGVDTAYHYINAARTKLAAENYCVAAVSPHRIEEVGFDLFVEDLKAFREAQ